MPNYLIAIVAFVLAIFFIILIHELGHFAMARWFKIKVKRLSIGFGKPIYSWRDKRGTEYVITYFPLGGYVKMLDEREGPVSKEDQPYAFNRQGFWPRFLVLFAGPLSNFLFAILIYWVIFMVGITLPKPIIGEVLPSSIASQAGLDANMEFKRIQGVATPTWQDFFFTIFPFYGDGDKVPITVKKVSSQTPQPLILDLRHWHINPLKPRLLKSLGIEPWKPKVKNRQKNSTDLPWPKDHLHTAKYNFFPAGAAAINKVWVFTKFNFSIIEKLITGKLSFRILAGPISIFKSVEYATAHGFIMFLMLMALLNVSIGFINLIPIPGLDGGHVLLLVIEKLTGKELSSQVQVLLYRLGVIALFVLIVKALANDLLRM